MRAVTDSAPLRARGCVSLLYRLHPVVKIIGLVCLFVLAVSLQKAVHGVLLALFIAGMTASGMDLARYQLKFKTIFFFAAFIFLGQVFFTGQGRVLLEIVGGLAVTDAGLHNGAVIAIRFLNIISASFLFVESTPGAQLATALMQSGVPYRYAFLLAIAMRFMPVFGAEMNMVRNAQLARGLDLETGSLKKIWQMARYTFLPLIVNALQRADVLAMSMEGRGFGMYEIRTHLNPVKFTRADIISGVLSVFLTVIILLLEHFTILS